MSTFFTPTFPDLLILGVRILDLDYPASDFTEAQALTHRQTVMDIYSNSWGPADSGEDFDALPEVIEEALKEGVEQVRKL